MRFLIRPELWEELPPRWEEVFGRQAPLALEIGFGNGEFLADRSLEQREWNWVGLETSLTCIVKAGRRLAQAGATHVRLALVEGRFGMRELFPDESLTWVFLHFPCPWPKARHARRRLVDGDFARTLAAVLAPEGEFVLTTDALWYAEDAEKTLEEAGLSPSGPENLTRGPATRYEMKWRSYGREIWQIRASRIKRGEIKRIAEGKMPHAKVPIKFDPQRILGVTGLRETWPAGTFVIKEAFLGQDEVLLRAFSTDQGFQQQYFITVSEAEGGALVQLDGATIPFRTPAVKRSVAAVAEYLERG